MTESITITPIDVGNNDFWLDTTELLAEIQRPQRRIPEYFGYDETGSSLFEQITELPNYYLTTTETELFRRHADAIADALRLPTIVELGSGSAKKTKLLLSGCAAQRATVYMPVDVSRSMLEFSAADLTRAVPALTVHALWGRYESGFAWLRDADREPVTVAFLGSNIGNMTKEKREPFYQQLQSALRPGDQFFVTADLYKPAQVFEDAYNDPPGRTAFAQFRLNRLTHLNRLFDGDFDVHFYYSRARYDVATAMVEAHVYATEDQKVHLAKLDTALHLQRDESFIVDHARKYHPADLETDLAVHGLTLTAQWIDAAMQYGAFLFHRR